MGVQAKGARLCRESVREQFFRAATAQNSFRPIKRTHGGRCPECGKGNVYGQNEPKVLVRIIGQAPLAATVYSLERSRCGACGLVFTA